MSLQPLSRIGPYEIVARLGAGSMGEVYRARDPRLGRDVAIKILPADVSADPGRRARFEQEARAVAALNHPNILGLYDIGNEDGVAYLVTEFVTGETLAKILEAGPLPPKKLLDIAVQIADGMAAAHAARITHRDLKPLNIMISAEGRVKILDFGLAKQAALELDPDATVADTQTRPGMILGTVSYMSPEQARGVPTDYRSDQFSFGQILYEMATGKRAFDRMESVQTMAAIISDEPPPIQQNIPGPLRWTIERCLAKDPSERFESSRDLYQGLRSLRDHASESSSAHSLLAPPVAKQRAARTAVRRFAWPILAGAFVLGLVLPSTILRLRNDTMTDQSAYRFTPFSFVPGGQFRAVWAPDGKSVAYAARETNGPYQTYIRYLDSATPIKLTHTGEDTSPLAWAPDGMRLILSIDREPLSLWSIATVGGEPEAMVQSIPMSRAMSVSPDNLSIAYFYPSDRRYSVWISSPPGAAPKKYLPEPFATTDLYNQPKIRFSPDGKKLLLMLNSGRDREEAWILPYPPDASKPPKRVLANMQSAAGTPAFSWMPDSRHIVVALAGVGETAEQLWMADTVSDKYYALTSGTTSRGVPAASPDGQKLIFRESTGSFDIVAVDVNTAAVRPFIVTERNELMPAFAERKPALAYVTDRNGPSEIWLRAADGSDRPLVTAKDFAGTAVQWLMGPALSPEADRVVYTKIDLGGNGTRLWITAAAGGAPVQLTNDSTSAEFPGSWSPDGAWFVYLSFHQGKPRLMKAKTSGQATPVLLVDDVSFETDCPPIFSPDGQSILLGETLHSAEDGKEVRSLGRHRAAGYGFSRDGKKLLGLRPSGGEVELISVDVATGSEKSIGKLSGDYVPRSNINPAMHFTLTPDGQSMVYGVGKFKENLWLLEGFAAKSGWLAKFGL